MASVMTVRREPWLRTVILHGDAAEQFGEVHQLDVATPGEAVRAIQANHPDFFKYLYEAEAQGVGFAVLLNDRKREGVKYSLSEEQLFDRHPIGSRTLEIVPMPLGAGGKAMGIVQIVLGVVLITLAVLAGPVGWAVLAPIAKFAGLMGVMGAGLVLGGTASLLVQTPTISQTQLNRDEGPDTGQKRLPSYAFSGAVNTTAQGRPVPIGYGTMLIGSHVVSIGIRSF